MKSLIILVSVAMAACFSFQPIEDHIQYYLLNSPSKLDIPTSPSTKTIGLRIRKMPDYCSQTKLFYCIGDTQIVFLDQARWSSDFTDNVASVLAKTLYETLKTPVYTFPFGNQLTPDIVIDLEFDSFKNWLNGNAKMTFNLTLNKDNKTAHYYFCVETNANTQATYEQTILTAIEAGLKNCSQVIANTITQN